MERFKLPEDQPMEAKILSNQIENAQKKVEEQNFVARKNVLKYDDVMNVQRQVIYEQRRRVLEGADLSEEVKEEWLPEGISNVASEYTAAELREDWDLDALVAAMDALYGTGVPLEGRRGPAEAAFPRGSRTTRSTPTASARPRSRGSRRA